MEIFHKISIERTVQSEKWRPKHLIVLSLLNDLIVISVVITTNSKSPIPPTVLTQKFADLICIKPNFVPIREIRNCEFGFHETIANKVGSLLEHSCTILISFKIVVIFNISNISWLCFDVSWCGIESNHNFERNGNHATVL